jgi:hypothetical protein
VQPTQYVFASVVGSFVAISRGLHSGTVGSGHQRRWVREPEWWWWWWWVWVWAVKYYSFFVICYALCFTPVRWVYTNFGVGLGEKIEINNIL